MDNNHQREVGLYEAAMALKGAKEQRLFLDRECGRDTSLRQKIERLLALHGSAEAFFKTASIDSESDTTTPCGASTEGSAPTGPGSMIGRYKILEQIGQGGFGMVYMAEQVEPIRRRVALKILKLGMDTQEVIARFEAERQALALLDHPNVAKVLDAGATETGRPYFVMELVPGCSITDYCDENRLTARERLELFVPACLAVQHAHQKGVIHRDLKPSNILVTSHDGRPMPKIIDFGVAKAIGQSLTERTLFTRFGRMIGTPAYMSPEQSELSGLDIDTRSDIFSLGVVLYELLTGKPPLEPERLHHAALAEMQRIIQEEEPPRPSVRIDTLGDESRTVAERRRTDPRKLGRLLSGDLDWIVMKTLEKDRQQRYPSASALADDIERHLHDEPVSAGPPRLSYRLRKLVRRHRRTAVSISLALLFLWVGFLLATAGFVKARQERNRALAAEDRSEKERRVAQQEARRAREREARERMVAYASDMGLAKSAADSGNLGRTSMLLHQHLPSAQRTDLREWEWRYLWQQCQNDALATLYRHTSAVYRVAFSSDKQEAAVGGFDGALVVVDLEARQPRARLQDSGPPCLVQYSPTEKYLAATDAQGKLRLWRTTPPIQSLLLNGPATRLAAMAFSRDGRNLAAVESSGRLWIWDMSSHDIITNFQATPFTDIHNSGLVFADPPDRLWIGGRKGEIGLIEALSGRALKTWRPHGGMITALALSPDNLHLASGSGFLESTVKVWDPVKAKCEAELEGHRAWISALAYSPDGAWLASASADQSIRLWDVQKNKLAYILRGHLHEVWTLAFSPDSRTLISGGKDGTVHLWRAKPQARDQSPVVLPKTMPRPVFTSKVNQHMICWNMEGYLLRWDGVSLRETVPFESSTTRVRTLRGSLTRGVLACVTMDNLISILDTTTWRTVAQIPLTANEMKDQQLIFSANGAWMVLVTEGRHVQVIDTRDWRKKGGWSTEKPLLTSVEVSNDGALLASGGPQLHLWKLADGKLLHEYPAHKQPTDCIAFSPDGRLLATASQEGSAKLWEMGSWLELAELRGHLLGIHCLAFSPNSLRLATGSVDQEAVKLWDLRTYREVFSLALPITYVVAVEFSPDGNTLCAFGEDDHGFQNYLWSVPSMADIQTRETTSRNAN